MLGVARNVTQHRTCQSGNIKQHFTMCYKMKIPLITIHRVTCVPEFWEVFILKKERNKPTLYAYTFHITRLAGI